MPGPLIRDPYASPAVPQWLRDLRDWTATPQAPDFWSTKVPEPGKTLATEGLRQLLGFGLDPRNQLDMLAMTKGGGPAGPPAAAKGIRAYHGSPHDFDRFDLSKLGTGQGAASYGHGLYFAEAEPVAQSYRRDLSRPTPERPLWRLRGEPVLPGTEHWPLASALENRLPQEGESMPDFLARNIAALEDHGRFVDKAYGAGTGDMYRSKAERLRRIAPGELTKHEPGYTYEVNLKVDPSELLDWDVPLSAQSPQVQGALQRLLRDDVRPVQVRPGQYGVTRVSAGGAGELVDRGTVWGATPEEAMRRFLAAKQETPGSDLYRIVQRATADEVSNRGAIPAWARGEGDAAVASAHLREAGIPGLRYRDEFSRTSIPAADREVMERGLAELLDVQRRGGIGGDLDQRIADLQQRLAASTTPTRNYVIWEDSLIDILRKYGFLLPAAAAGHAATRDRSQVGTPPPARLTPSY